MLHVAICDDEKEYLENTAGILGLWSAQVSIPITLHCFNDGDALISASKTQKFDIIFLDIIMPMLNGMDTAKELRNRDRTVKIVFLTSSRDFALDSYSVKATDYCIKPATYERIKEIMDECTLLSQQEPEHLILKTVSGYKKIYLHEIEYIEAQNKHSIFFLTSGKCIEAMQPLYTFEQQLPDSKGFFKCHRSYIVYIPNVDFFCSNTLTTKSGCMIPISRNLSKEFHNAYFSVMFHD